MNLHDLCDLLHDMKYHAYENGPKFYPYIIEFAICLIQGGAFLRENSRPAEGREMEYKWAVKHWDRWERTVNDWSYLGPPIEYKYKDEIIKPVSINEIRGYLQAARERGETEY